MLQFANSKSKLNVLVSYKKLDEENTSRNLVKKELERKPRVNLGGRKKNNQWL
jgi:hypothetical protein